MAVDVAAIRQVESAFFKAWEKFCQLDNEAIPAELRLHGAALDARKTDLKTEMEALRASIDGLRGML